jgi:hypothetical protein
MALKRRLMNITCLEEVDNDGSNNFLYNAQKNLYKYKYITLGMHRIPEIRPDIR